MADLQRQRRDALRERRRGQQDVRKAIVREIDTMKTFLEGPAKRQNLSEEQVSEMRSELAGMVNVLAVIDRNVIDRPDEALDG